MFFKMLKSDLKRKRGLNVILFVFISVASILVFAGSVQIFSIITSEKTAERLCKSSDTIFWTLDTRGDRDEIREKTVKVLGEDENVTEWEASAIARIGIANLDFPDCDEKKHSYYLTSRTQCLSTLPHEHDLYYDTDDKPFYVPNGCVAVSVGVSLETGIKRGDILRFTTDSGYTYELKVCSIFKENTDDAVRRYIVSDADFEVLTRDCVRKYTSYSVCLRDASDEKQDELSEKLDENGVPTVTLSHSDNLSNDVVMTRIIAAFIILISVFLITIIFMTIRFTLVADLKSDEKEIGMMKALGIESFSFRWLFAAKYIAFAVVGGAMGIAAGLPLAAMLVNMFGPDSILPERYIMVLIGVLSVAVMITVMIAFSLFVMRRIKRISVIDAIHGENRGERFGKGFPMFLHKRKRMSVPLFLALTDILGRFKRYIFLIIAYSLGVAILLLVFNVRHSIVNPHYTRYWLYHDYDFSFGLSDEESDDISREMMKTGKTFYEVINDRFAEADIPAHIDVINYGGGYILHDDESITFIDIMWKDGEPEKYTYRRGGTAPRLANEAAMSAFTAKKIGVKTGDVIKVRINENNEDHTGSVENEHEIVITALIDYMEEQTPLLIMGDEYEGAYKWGYRWTGAVIDAPESEKPAVIEQMRDHFDGEIYSGKQAVSRAIGNFDRLFVLLEYGVGGAVLLVLMLITYLYMSIFIAEEVPETALLKSMGFRGISIKAEYMLRIALLLMISLAFGEVYIWTLGNYLFEVFMRQYGVSGMRFEFEFPVSFIVIPLLMLGCFLLTAAFTLRGIKHIGIWKISEE
ncbi:MAG: ABC transporter permease [Ruminococcus sp.]|nr:ABC transporter permease [Ruminococcus sp.]